MFLRRCQWLGRSQNLVDRLTQRKLLAISPAQAYHRNRSLYQCIVPNHTEHGVRTPPGFLRKFSPDGRWLLAFSNSQSHVVIYEYCGASAAHRLYQSKENVQDLLFETFFRLRFSIPVASNGEHLNRECSLFTEDCQHAIVVSSDIIRDDQDVNMLDIFRNNESITTLSSSPMEDYTLYLVDLLRGVVSDSVTFKCDKINLSHNQGLSLCNSTLAVLCLQQQTIHLFNIRNGTLILQQEIGRFCHPNNNVTLPDLSVVDPTNLYSADSVSEKWFTTLKHRLMCYLLRRAEEQCTKTDRFPLANYFNKYKTLISLRLAKIQLLDENHLLLKYSNMETITQKPADSSSQPSLYVFYNIDSTEVLTVHENTSEEFLKIYETYADSFRYPVAHPLCRNTSSLSNNSHSRALHERFKDTIKHAKYGGCVEATRRLLSQLPVCSQSFSCSPYLDLALFYYDDKLISPLERPKQCGDNPVRFFSRENGRCKFQLENAVVVIPVGSGRRLVAYIFHPSEPFVISIQKAAYNDYVISFHFRNCYSSS